VTISELQKPVPTVRAIRLENFMAFEDTGWIELAPISLVFGLNSSGKSVIVRALRLLKQSLDNRPDQPPLSFYSEDGVDVDNFLTAFNWQALAKLKARYDEAARQGFPVAIYPQMTFHLRCDVPDLSDDLRSRFNHHRETRGGAPLSATKTPTWADLRLQFGWSPDLPNQSARVELVGCRVTLNWDDPHGDEGVVLVDLELLPLLEEHQTVGETQPYGQWSHEWQFESDILTGYQTDAENSVWTKVQVNRERGWLPSLAILQSHNPATPSKQDYEFVVSVLDAFQRAILAFFTSLQHLGPLRPPPQRIYTMDRATQARWERQGWSGWVQFLLGDIDTATLTEIGTWMARLRLGDSVQASAYKEGKLGFTSTVRILGDQAYVNTASIVDVGSGASQVLPILVQGLLASPGSLVMVEEPELHLHPKAQAILADFFVTMADRQIRFLLETHSEPLILRMHFHIAGTNLLSHLEAEAKKHERSVDLGRDAPSVKDALQSVLRLLPAHLATYYVGSSMLRQREVFSVQTSEFGDFTNPPEKFKAFFADSGKEVMDITYFALKAEQLAEAKS
jgi:hypothetical protein